MVDWILDQVRWKASRRSCSYSSRPSSSCASTSRGLFADLGLEEDGSEASIRHRAREGGTDEAAATAALWRTKNGCKKKEMNKQLGTSLSVVNRVGEKAKGNNQRTWILLAAVRVASAWGAAMASAQTSRTERNSTSGGRAGLISGFRVFVQKGGSANKD